ncbi:MAG TPA: DRTGG domain-containing protein, partial [Verrucomicrobiae bacterium]|nr:DRTGG domain-containing protein [Verrucomicrobiae bacterium]
MSRQIYVIGHRNPDTDSIASAIAYADLKRKLGNPQVKAAMAGDPNPQTRFILSRLGLEMPVYLADVRPKVRDVLGRRPVTATADMPLKEVLGLFHRHSIRVVPVVDGGGVPVGLVSLLKLSEKYLVAGTGRRRGIDTSLRSLASCIDGAVLVGEAGGTLEHLHMFIGAMAEESFIDTVSGHDASSLLIITGDRPSIQNAAIDLGVRLLVVTGGLRVEEGVLRRAEARGVTVISTPHDTATAAALARLSTPLFFFCEGSFEKIGVAEPREHLRVKLMHSGEPAVVAVEEDGSIAGIATKSS